MAFSSVAQLIESTYMATHSSFFAMVGVADQLGSLKTYLGQVLGVFSILRLGRRILNWLKGKKVRAGAEGWANEWSSGGLSLANGHGQGVGTVGAPRPSAKPLLLFLLSALGLPYLMSRLVKLLVATQQKQQQAEMENLDPSKLTFARALWEFRAGEEWELNLARDEIVAVLEKREGQGPGQAGEGGGNAGWWRGRTRDGRVGWFPGNYVSEESILPCVVRGRSQWLMSRWRSYSGDRNRRSLRLTGLRRQGCSRTCKRYNRRASTAYGPASWAFLQ